MSRIKALARLLTELDDQLLVCMRCGLCQAVCPLFAETGRETDVARGKLALLDGLAKELFDNPRGVQDRLSRCLLCGSCAAHCPNGVKVLDIFIKARSILAGYMGLSPVKKIIFRGLLARPETFNRILSWGAKFQGIFIKPVDDLLGSSCSRFLSPVLRSRHFKPLATTPFQQLLPSVDIAVGRSGLKVAFFVGCLLDKVFPPVALAVLEVLKHRGVGVLIPSAQACCGIPALSSGDADTFGKLLKHNLGQFDPDAWDYLVTACATCTATISKMWPLMSADLPALQQQQIAVLAQKTVDINQFLVDRVGVEAAGAESVGERLPVTFHDPCHLKKSLGVATPPRALIHANPRYELREMNEADWCCGCGGSFSLQEYDISAAIGRRKRENIEKARCPIVVTSCPACMIQLIDMLSQAGAQIQVKHSVEIYAEALAAKGQEKVGR